MCEWLVKNPSPILFDDRKELYQYINNIVFNYEPIDFLEFGVAQGASLKYWLNLNNKKESQFFGFDTRVSSFGGLHSVLSITCA